MASVSLLHRCPVCAFSFDAPHWLIEHLRERNCPGLPSVPGTEQQMFPCTVCCSSTYATPGELADHLELCLVVQQQQLAMDVPKSSRQLEELREGWPGHEPEMMAAQCAVLQREVRGTADTNRRSHQCPVCDRRFFKAVDLRRHERTHSGERPFGCACGQRFKLKQTLETHQLTHRQQERMAAADQQFGCPVCQKQLLSRSALKLHLRIHTGECPFKCAQPECSSAFRTKKLMLTHYRNVHGNNSSDQQYDDFGIDCCVAAKETEQSRRMQAFDGLLALNSRIGPKLKVKQLGRSEHSAFNTYGSTKVCAESGSLSAAANSLGQNQQKKQMDHVGIVYNSTDQQQQSATSVDLTMVQQQNHQQQQQSSDTADCNTTTFDLFMSVNRHQQQQPFLDGTTFMRHPPMVPPPTSFFQTADAEYTREGQVHRRRPLSPPAYQFRTLTPTFVYQFTDLPGTVIGQQEESLLETPPPLFTDQTESCLQMQPQEMGEKY